MFLPFEIVYSLAFLFYGLSVIVHGLVIRKKIPYSFVNGGRSTTYETQKKQSQMSVVIIVGMFIYVLFTMLVPEFRTTLAFLILTSILVLFWLLGTVMQFIGTKFERRVMLWINLIGLLSHIGLVLMYFE